MTAVVRIMVVGATGYTGGELLRLLLDHPRVAEIQAASRSAAGRPVGEEHPNLLDAPLRFVSEEELAPCDVAFLCLPHGRSGVEMDRWAALAERVVDLSADFRLRDPAAHQRVYGSARDESWAERFVYGLPEVNRQAIAGARFVCGVGCNATAAILALWPLAREGLLEGAVVEALAGSSEGGRTHSPATHHPVRAGAVRAYAPTGHRHEAEASQALGTPDVQLGVIAIDRVRGVFVKAHPRCATELTERELWRLFDKAYRDEPFVRIVARRQGLHRLPDPRTLMGANYADVGFAVDERQGRVATFAAIDNLMKGAAGNAVQCMNLMLGFDEREGLGFRGLHPA